MHFHAGWMTRPSFQASLRASCNGTGNVCKRRSRRAVALGQDMHASAASLRLLSDLKAISQSPPEGVSASPTSEDNLYVWAARFIAATPSIH